MTPGQTQTTGAAASSSPAPKLAAQQVLRFAVTQEDLASGLDVIKTSGPDLDIGREIYSFLVRIDRNGSTSDAIVPDLAESWQRSTDGLTWTFKLRKGVRFQKGYGELTADDAVFSLLRLSSKESYFSADVKNWTTISAVDPSTVQIVTAKPDPFLLQKLADLSSTFAAIVSKKAVTELGAKYPYSPIGTGPFELKEYRAKDRVILTRNENYYGTKPTLERLEFVFIPDQTARGLALQNGDIEGMVVGPDPKLVSDLTGKGFKRFDGPIEVQYLYLRVNQKPFNDLKVRQAVAYAINFKALNDFFAPFYKYEPPLRVWQTNLSAYDAVKGKVADYPYDTQKAKQLLADAGYPNGFSVQMKMSTGSPQADMMTIVQRDLKAVGIDLQLQMMEFGPFHASVRAGESTIAWLRTARALEIELPLQYFYGPAAPLTGTTVYNYSYYNNQQVNSWIEQAAVELDQAKRQALFAQIHEQIMKDLPVIPLLWGANGAYVFSPRVDFGYSYHSVDNRYPLFTPQTRIVEVGR